MEHGAADRDLPLRIPDDDIRIRPDGDRALAGIEAVNLGGIGRRDGDKGIEVDPSLADAFRVEQRHPRLDARHTRCDVAEMRMPAAMGALALAALEQEGAVIRGNH